MGNNGYTGYQSIVISEDAAAMYFQNQVSINELSKDLNKILNCYYPVYMIHGTDVDDTTLLDIYVYKNSMFKKVNKNKFESLFSGKLHPRNPEQEMAFDALKDNTTTVKLLTGKWGVGKTLLLSAAAMEALEHKRFERIVWVRNNVQVKDTDALGALPGSAIDKVLPYVMPLADHCGGIEGLKSLIADGTLDVIPLGYLRGRSIRNSIIISSEAENLTREHIQLLLGRVDEGSNLWMDADLRQRDKQVFEASHGVEKLIQNLTGNPLFSYVHLDKSERSDTARLADLLDE